MSAGTALVTASTASITVRLTERQVDVLRELTGETVRGKWLRPMDIGGRDASWHSGVLSQLHRKGLVARQLHGGFTRNAWRYRVTAEGRAVWAALPNERKRRD